jgi:hypothetical protein
MDLMLPKIEMLNAYRYFAAVAVFCSAIVAPFVFGTAADPRPRCLTCQCTFPTTLSEQLQLSDTAVLAAWVSASKPVVHETGGTTYEIVRIARSRQHAIEKGKQVTIKRYQAGKAGDLWLLLASGSKGDEPDWYDSMKMSTVAYEYLVEAPSAAANSADRLAYFQKFLEHADSVVAGDSYAEFANAPFKDIIPLSKQFPRESLRKWVVSPDVPAPRLGLYGLMLGLCGNDQDAAMMEAKITETTEGFRLGIEGIMGGYLLLTGEKGLETIEASKLQSKEVPFSETYAAIQALRFLWTYGNGRIPAERLRTSMRLLLDRPEVSDLVIADLARWKDWSVQSRLMELYGAEEYNIPSIKRAIIRYMIASTKDVPAGDGEEKPAKHVADGTKCLQKLRDKDAKMVNEVERYFFLQ